MNSLLKKTLNKSILSLNRVPLYSFARNIKTKPSNFTEKTKPKEVLRWSMPASITEASRNQPSEDLKWTQTSNADPFKLQNEKPITFEEIDTSSLEDNRVLQNHILRLQTVDALIDLYAKHKNKFNLVNVCTCFHRVVQISSKDADVKNSSIVKKTEVRDMIEYLRRNIPGMNNFSVSNFLSNLAKLNFIDDDLVEKLIQLTLQNKIAHNEKSLTYITWALGKFKIKNKEFLDFVSNEITKPGRTLKPRSLCSIFWAMSQNDYRNSAVMYMMEKFIRESKSSFDKMNVNLTFSAYNNYKMTNLDVLDILSQDVIRNIKSLDLRHLANISNYCANLNYVNHNLLDSLEREIVRRLKKSPDFQNIIKDNGTSEILQKSSKDSDFEEDEESDFSELEGDKDEELNEKKLENVKLETQKAETKETNTLQDTNTTSQESGRAKAEEEEEERQENIKSIDISQILVSFCKLKVIKSELFELLELHFIKNLNKATPSSIQSYAFAHSALCSDMLQKYQDNKKMFLKRSIKNLKKYNHNFYEILIPFLKLKLPEFTPEGSFSLLVSASRPGVTKRAIKKGLLEFGVMMIPKLTKLKETYSLVEYEKFLYKYNLMLQNYAYKKEHIAFISEGFNNAGINISLLDKAYSQILPNQGPRFLEEDEKFFDNKNDKEDDY